VRIVKEYYDDIAFLFLMSHMQQEGCRMWGLPNNR